MVSEIHKHNALIYAWVFRDDSADTLDLLNVTSS